MHETLSNMAEDALQSRAGNAEGAPLSCKEIGRLRRYKAWSVWRPPDETMAPASFSYQFVVLLSVNLMRSKS